MEPFGACDRIALPPAPSPLPLRGVKRGEWRGLEAGGFAARLKPPLSPPRFGEEKGAGGMRRGPK